MLSEEMKRIVAAARETGWVLEPEAKRLFALAGFEVPRFLVATDPDGVRHAAREIGYPLVAKIVSPKIVHKSDSHGVAVGIKSDEELMEVFERFSRFEAFQGVLVEEMVSGLELIIGAKNDFQFGPIILLGIGGTGVEIYRDVALRMAPLSPRDTDSMIRGLKAHRLLEDFRGKEPINLNELKRLLVAFSTLVIDLEKEIESIDLNPVMCTSSRCVIADARIMLRRSKSGGEVSLVHGA